MGRMEYGIRTAHASNSGGIYIISWILYIRLNANPIESINKTRTRRANQ